MAAGRDPCRASRVVSEDHVAIIDGPPATAPTVPDRRRAAIASIRAQADVLEANL